MSWTTKIFDFFTTLRSYLPKKKSVSGPNTQVDYFKGFSGWIFNALLWTECFGWIVIFTITLTFFMDLQFYALVGLISLTIFIYNAKGRDFFKNYYNEEQTERLTELQIYLGNLGSCMRTMRKEKPIIFYPLMSILFLTIHMASRDLSHKSAQYLILILLWAPHAVLLLPEWVFLKMKNSFSNIESSTYPISEEELIPYIRGKDFNKKDADLESLLTDRTADSITNSLISGITSMPSHLEVLETANDIEEDDLIPFTGKSGVSYTPGELSSDSDSDNKEIKFDSDHFNASSSEDDPFSKDLSFPKVVPTVAKETNQDVGMFRSMINTVGSHVLTNMFQSAVQAPVRKANSSDSDSDFELVDPAEVLGSLKNKK